MPKSANDLPPNAKMVFKGALFEVWQWEQKMFDGSAAIFEKLKRPDTLEVIPMVGDKIMVQIQEQPHSSAPFVSLPGGRRNGGENPLDGAKRELAEETGYASEKWELWKTQNPISKIIWTIYTYIARDCYYAKPPQLDAGEKIEIKLLSFDEFLDLADNPTFYDKELSVSLLKAKYNATARDDLKKILFDAN